METIIENPSVAGQDIMAELETRRKEIYDARIKNYWIIGGGIALIVIAAMLGGLLYLLIPGAIIIIYAAVMLSNLQPKKQQYRYMYKHSLVADALKTIDESLQIDDMQALSEQEFIDTQLFSRRPDRYHSEDQVYGHAGRTKFCFSEVHAEYKEVTQTKNGQRTDWYDLLKGIVFCADFNKNFKGLTVVRPKSTTAALGAWLSNAIPLFSSSGQLVKLENPIFDKNFITFSSDQIEARYILTPAMMERICELNEQCSDTISLSFTGSEVFIGFPLSTDYFEPPYSKSLYNNASLQQDINLVRFMYGIIKELDLNTRIWGKE